MTDDMLLDILYGISLFLASVLIVMSSMSVGKHLSELQYQIAKKLNGIRRVQSITNLRIHANRGILGIIYLSSVLLNLLPIDLITRIWVIRILFVILLVIFVISSFLDWAASQKQLEILLKYEEVNNITSIRLNLHKLNNRLTELYGVSDLESNDKHLRDDIQIEIAAIISLLQHDIHAMDPSYDRTVSNDSNN